MDYLYPPVPKDSIIKHKKRGTVCHTVIEGRRKPENTIMDISPRHKRRSIMQSCNLNEKFLRSQ